MTDRHFTEADVIRIAKQAVTLAIAERPIPATVTTAEAARLLDVSVSTIQRMKPKRVGTKIPYSWVAERLK